MFSNINRNELHQAALNPSLTADTLKEVLEGYEEGALRRMLAEEDALGFTPLAYVVHNGDRG